MARRILGFLLVLTIFGIGYVSGARSRGGGNRFVVCSPDSRFRLEVFPIGLGPLFSMPGGGGDRPGRVRLVDNRSGRVHRESASIPLINTVTFGSFQWGKDSVSVRLDAEGGTVSEDWPLRAD